MYNELNLVNVMVIGGGGSGYDVRHNRNGSRGGDSIFGILNHHINSPRRSARGGGGGTSNTGTFYSMKSDRL